MTRLYFGVNSYIMVKRKGNSMTYIALAVAAVLVGIDQFTKYLVSSSMELHQTIPLISFGDKEVLNLSYEINDGAAFSMLAGKQTFLIIITSIVILAAIYLLLSKRVKKPIFVWPIAIIIAGGVGNLIDRIANQYVVDFIDFRVIKFAVFNFADICAVCGSIALFVFVVVDEVRNSKTKKLQDSENEKNSAENPMDNQDETADGENE